MFKADLSSLGEMGVLTFASKLFLKVPFSSRSLESCSCHINDTSLNGKNQNIDKEQYNELPLKEVKHAKLQNSIKKQQI